MMTNKEFEDIGFKSIPHFTVSNNLIYDLGRNRHLSVGDVGTPNEMLWICSTDEIDNRKITDLICLHNYDYDGYITKEKLISLINGLGITNEEN